MFQSMGNAIITIIIHFFLFFFIQKEFHIPLQKSLEESDPTQQNINYDLLCDNCSFHLFIMKLRLNSIYKNKIYFIISHLLFFQKVFTIKELIIIVDDRCIDYDKKNTQQNIHPKTITTIQKKTKENARLVCQLRSLLMNMHMRIGYVGFFYGNEQG